MLVISKSFTFWSVEFSDFLEYYYGMQEPLSVPMYQVIRSLQAIVIQISQIWSFVPYQCGLMNNYIIINKMKFFAIALVANAFLMAAAFDADKVDAEVKLVMEEVKEEIEDDLPALVEEVTEKVEEAQLEKIKEEVQDELGKLLPIEPFMPIFGTDENGDVKMTLPLEPQELEKEAKKYLKREEKEEKKDHKKGDKPEHKKGEKPEHKKPKKDDKRENDEKREQHDREEHDKKQKRDEKLKEEKRRDHEMRRQQRQQIGDAVLEEQIPSKQAHKETRPMPKPRGRHGGPKFDENGRVIIETNSQDSEDIESQERQNGRRKPHKLGGEGENPMAGQIEPPIMGRMGENPNAAEFRPDELVIEPPIYNIEDEPNNGPIIAIEPPIYNIEDESDYRPQIAIEPPIHNIEDEITVEQVVESEPAIEPPNFVLGSMDENPNAAEFEAPRNL